jgi:hypothetical protein
MKCDSVFEIGERGDETKSRWGDETKSRRGDETKSRRGSYGKEKIERDFVDNL